jgi:N-acetyl-anhydromuramyl-L-alanine amidase AmpD
MDVGVQDIRKWHRAKGWSDVGYHYVIRRNGTVEKGRGMQAIGSHVRGLNAVSVGICLAGGLDENLKPSDNFTMAQKVALRGEIDRLLVEYPNAKVVGHRDVIRPGDPPKACPCFDAGKWYYRH